VSDTAVSSQIVSEVSSNQAASSTALSEQDSIVKTQASEFDDILEGKLDVSENLSSEEQLQALLNLNPLTNSSPLLESQLKASLQSLNAGTNGNSLPSGLASQLPINELMLKTANPLLNQNGLTEKPIALSVITPMTDNKVLLPQTELPLEEGVLAKQLSAAFNDKSQVDMKPLSTQFFNQYISQSQVKPLAIIDNTILPGVPSGIMVSQTMSVQSSEAVLPPITVSPENAQWNSQVGDRINWMVNNNMQRVEIRLDPPELGNLDIRLNLAKDNQASILVHVTNPTAKEAIESAIPRLREMFEQQGLDLGDVDVSQQNPQQQSEFEYSGNSESEQGNLANDTTRDSELNGESILESTKIGSNPENLLDIFA